MKEESPRNQNRDPVALFLTTACAQITQHWTDPAWDWAAYRTRVLAWTEPALRYALEHVQRATVLDVGAAYGVASLALAQAGFQVTALDYWGLQIPKALCAEHHIAWFACNIERDPLPGSVYDLILFLEVLEHLNYHPGPVLEKLYKATAPGGTLLLTTPRRGATGESARLDLLPLDRMPYYTFSS